MRFTQDDINKELIYYSNNLTASMADEISLKVRCMDAVNVAQIGVWILSAKYWEPLNLKMLGVLTVEESTSVIIDRSILEVSFFFFVCFL